MNRTTTLENGLRIHTIPIPSPVAGYQLLVPFGGDTLAYRDGADGTTTTLRPGCAHFFEHVLFIMPPDEYPVDGIRTPPHAPAGLRDGLSVLKGNKAIVVNAYTSHDITNYWFLTRERPHENLRTMIGYVNRPFLPNDRFLQEVGTISDEIARSENDADTAHFETWKQQLYVTHGTRKSVIGTKEDICGITIPDVLSLHRTFYRPSNMMLIGMGHVDHDATVALAREAYGALGKNTYEQPPVLPDQPEPDAVVRVHNLDDPLRRADVAQPKLLMGWKAPLQPGRMSVDERIDEHLTMRYATAVLFDPGTRSRERLIAAGIDARTFVADTLPLRDHAEIAVSTLTREPSRDMELILNAARHLVEHGIDPVEFAYARASLLTDESIARNDLVSYGDTVARWAVLTGEPDGYDRMLARLERTSIRTIADRLPEILAPRRFATSLMVPQDGWP